MFKITATLPGIGEVYIVAFVSVGKEDRAVYVAPDGRFGVALIGDFHAVRPPSKGLLLIGAKDA